MADSNFPATAGQLHMDGIDCGDQGKTILDVDHLDSISWIPSEDKQRAGHPIGEVFETRNGLKPVKTSWKNAAVLLYHIGVKRRFNLLSYSHEYQDGQHGQEPIFENCTTEEDRRIRVLNDAERAELSKASFTDHTRDPRIVESYHPVRDWIESEAWDNIDRVGSFLDRLTLDGDPERVAFYHTLIVRWMMSCLRILYDDPDSIVRFIPQGVLVLHGVQNKGKSTFLTSLAPPDMVLDSHALKVNDPTSIRAVLEHWIVELGELDAVTSRHSVGELKNHLTKGVHTYKKPYDIEITTRRATTVYAASTNRDDFLRDTTGDRRFWVVRLSAISKEIWKPTGKSQLSETQQLWAQLKRHLDPKEKNTTKIPDIWRTTLSDAEVDVLSVSNGEYRPEDPLGCEILEFWRPMTEAEIREGKLKPFSSKQVRGSLPNRSFIPDKKESSEITESMKRLRWQSVTKGHNGRLWYIAQKKAIERKAYMSVQGTVDATLLIALDKLPPDKQQQ